MPDMAYLKVGETSYNVKDITARNGVGDLNMATRDLPQIRESVSTNTTNITQLQTATQDLPQLRGKVTTLEENTADLPDLRQAVAQNTTDVSNLKSAINKYNLIDILEDATCNSSTVNGITWHWNADGSCSVSGTATALSTRLLVGTSTTIPNGVVPGGVYQVEYSSENVELRVDEYVNGTEANVYKIRENTTLKLLDNITGFRVRLVVPSGTTVNETVNPVILSGFNNQAISKQLISNTDETATLEANVKRNTSTIHKYNSYDVLEDATRNSSTVNGITWHWNADGSCSVSGTATALSARILCGDAAGEYPALVSPGEKYLIKHSSTAVGLEVVEYSNDTVLSTVVYKMNSIYHADPSATRIRVRLTVSNGHTVNEIVDPAIVLVNDNTVEEEETDSFFEDDILFPGNTKCISHSTGEEIQQYASLTVSDFIPTKGFRTLEMPILKTSASAVPKYGFHFYDKDKASVGVGYPSFKGREDGESCVVTGKFYIPGKAAYFRVTFFTEAYIEANFPTVTFWYRLLDKVEPKHITAECPLHVGMENVVKRARQFTDIEWTPLLDLPRDSGADGDYSRQTNATKHFEDVFKAGVMYKGLPYSGSTISRRNYGYSNFLLGLYVPIDAFITSIRYPNSCMSESYYDPSNPRSPTFYGTICSGLVCYALGLDHLVATSNMTTDIKGLSKVDGIPNMGANDLRLCDVILRSGHVAIITDLIRDDSGNVKSVEVSEATIVGNGNAARSKNALGGGWKYGGKCRRKCWAVEDFFGWFRMYSIYRYYNEAFFSVTYTPNKYVSVGDEADTSPTVDLSCIPYMGNKFVYKQGYVYNSTILIGDPDYSYLVVLKDGVAWNVNGTANPYEIVAGADSVDVGFTEAGNYEAYLCNIADGAITQRSGSCQWSVIDESADEGDDGGDD